MRKRGSGYAIRKLSLVTVIVALPTRIGLKRFIGPEIYSFIYKSSSVRSLSFPDIDPHIIYKCQI